jgi:pimeloyl-ACP methyl ester carboxylesterase
MSILDPETGLFYEETGPTGAPAIVFLHGGGGGGWMWRPQVERLPDYRCIVPDLPEHGRSPGPFSIQGAAEQVARLIRQRAPGGKAFLVGLSEGGQVGVALLALAPEWVERAVLSGVLARPILRGRLAERLGQSLISASHRLFMAPLKNNDAWIRLNMRQAVGIPDAYFPPFKQAFQATTREAFTHLMLENLAFDLPPGLERVTQPVLLLAGQKEDRRVFASARDLVKAMPGAQAYRARLDPRLPRAAHHNWSMSAPELFTQALRGWFTGQPLPPELEPFD